MLKGRLALATLPMALAMMTAAQSAGERAVAARVNGSPLYVDELVPEAAVTKMTADETAALVKARLPAAIETVLLHQEAVRRGLDQDPRLLAIAAAATARRRSAETRKLMAALEATVPALAEARDATTITDAEVEACYAADRARFDRYGADHAKRIAREQLAGQRYRLVYADWLLALVQSVPVRVNGKGLPAATVAEAVKYNYGLLPPAAQPAAPTWQMMLAAAGLTVPDLAEDNATRQLLTAFQSELTKVELAFGETVCHWAEIEELRDLAVPAPAAGALVEPTVFEVMRSQLIAEAARQAGVGATVAAASQAPEADLLRDRAIQLLLAQAAQPEPTEPKPTPEQLTAARAALVAELRSQAAIEAPR